MTGPDTGEAGYAVVDADGGTTVPADAIDQFPSEYEVLSEALGLEQLHVNVWRYGPGDETAYHAHREQEELYYILRGEFELTLGDPGETETRTVGPGAFYAAGPTVGHGHRYLGDEEGVVLGFGAPGVDDAFLDPEVAIEERD